MRVTGLRIVITREAIEARLDELAAQINGDYTGKDLVVVCVLKGGFMFFSSLVGRLSCHPQLDFVRLASYGSGTESRDIAFRKDVELPLEGRHVLVVEDIVDTGRSMDFLLRHLAKRGAASLRLAALLDKKARRAVDIEVDYRGFDLPDGFLVGYGLDYAERYRELPAVYELMFADD